MDFIDKKIKQKQNKRLPRREKQVLDMVTGSDKAGHKQYNRCQTGTGLKTQGE